MSAFSDLQVFVSDIDIITVGPRSNGYVYAEIVTDDHRHRFVISDTRAGVGPVGLANVLRAILDALATVEEGTRLVEVTWDQAEQPEGGASLAVLEGEPEEAER